MIKDTPTHAFLFIAPCGCIDTIAGDDGRHDAAAIAALRDGSRVERLPIAEAKARFCAEPEDCPHTPKWGSDALSA